MEQIVDATELPKKEIEKIAKEIRKLIPAHARQINRTRH